MYDPESTAVRRVLVRSAYCLMIAFGPAAVAAPCDAQPGNSRETECRREAADLQRRLEELLTRYTDLHPEVRSLRRTIQERDDCGSSPASIDADAMAAGTTATIAVDAQSELQALHGFGATYPLSMFEGDHITQDQQRRVVALLVSDIGALTGQAQPAFEAVRSDAPATETGFSRPLDFSGTEKLFRMFDRYASGGVGDIYPFASINVRWQHPWLAKLRSTDYERYLDEVAGKAVATIARWKDRSGREPEFLQLWNEPISGNGELGGGTLRELVDTVRRVGRRLREAGYTRVRLVVPNEETVRNTLAAVRAIAGDGEALRYVGAIAYHAYPYGSEYSYLPRLLATRAQGRDFQEPVREREELRNLSMQLGLPVWMTEISHGYSRGGSNAPEAVADSIDWIVGRAIHIHDEFRFAGASAFYGMMAVWTDTADRDHSPGAGVRNLRKDGDNLVLVDTVSNEVFAGAIGYAMGHYGRWLHRDARYLKGESSNPFVLVSPFRDGARFVAVLVNTAKKAVRTTIRLQGAEFAGTIAGDQTRTGSCRQAIAPFEAEGPSLELELPAWSVTSVAVPLR